MEDPRIAQLRDLLDQATKLLKGANQLVADLTEQLNRASESDTETLVTAKRRKP